MNDLFNPDTWCKDFQRPYWRTLVEISNARCQGANPGSRGVFWHGAPGVGKTFLAEQFCEMARRSKLRMPEGYWREVKLFAGNVLDLVAELQAAIGKDKNARTQFEMLREIKEADVVFLDDLGRERENFGQSAMFNLLDRALASNATVIVTSNRTAKELADYYGADAGLRSRLSALKAGEWAADLPNLRKAAVAEALARA
ncbi:MAG: ATP-binding protein [Planctomycetes bacterium]|nr:ATP-binding protein [Planctomycetota bacterium]